MHSGLALQLQIKASWIEPYQFTELDIGNQPHSEAFKDLWLPVSAAAQSWLWESQMGD